MTTIQFVYKLFILLLLLSTESVISQLLIPMNNNNNQANLLQQQLQLRLLALSQTQTSQTQVVNAQQPIIQTCTRDAACSRCSDQSTIVINNGRVVSTNVRRILRNRLDDGTAPQKDICCSGCQPIIGDANVINPGTNVACSITCDYSQNSQNVANLANLGNLGGINTFNGLGAYGYNGLTGLGGLGGTNPLALGGFNSLGLGGFNSLGLGGLGLPGGLFFDALPNDSTAS